MELAEQRLRDGHDSLTGLLHSVDVRWIDESELRAVDPDLGSFVNINTPEEWESLLARST